MTRRNPRGAVARILPRLWGARHTPASWERSLHVRVVRGSSSIAEQVASYHQVPVQIRPPALTSAPTLTPEGALTTMHGGPLKETPC